MPPAKLKAVAIPLLLVATVGVAAALGVHSAKQRKQYRSDEYDLEQPFESAEQLMPFSVTTPVGADVPVPDEYSISVNLQHVIYQNPFSGPGMRVDRGGSFRALPEGAVVLREPPYDRVAITEAYNEAHALGKKGEVAIHSGAALSIMSAGPLLPPNTQVVVRHMVRHGQRIELEIVHAPYPIQSEEAPIGENWRPLVVVPLLLPAGTYELKTTWRSFERPPPTVRLEESKPLDQPPVEYLYTFKMVHGMGESPVVRAAGADFQALADSPCRIPSPVERFSAHLGLRITNRGDKDLLFDPRGVGLFHENMKTVDGRPLRYGGGSDGTFITRPVPVGARKSHLFLIRGQTEWVRSSEPMRLSGFIGAGDSFWSYQGIPPGKYHLTFDYAVGPQPLRPAETYWTGRVRSGAVTIEFVQSD